MAINLDVHGNTQPLEAAVQAAVNRIRRQPIKITVDDKGATQPLGNMKRGADEFTKSMEAANARILAFGASMAIINGVADAFKGMVRNMVEVEKALADINVVMGLSAKNLDAFSDGLFKVAKETASSFKIAADAATEYARQGLSVEESLKRTKDALILTRLTGMDSAEAVKSLTAAMNTYGHQIKDTTQLVSKFAAVDVKFAVSAEDFADAISRTGAAAKGAGVDIDELIGIVTAAQQQTARGGKVIGNSLKTIFTRVGRTDTLNQLENLGIAVRDVEGNTLGAKRILTDLANTFDKLTESQKAQIAQTVGGVFQINVLKAILGDAAKQNGILANATQISASATDEAIDKNEQLNKTLSALVSQTGTSLIEMSSKLGEITLGPGLEKILNTVKGMAEGLNTMLGDGEGTGSKFATGLLKGIGNVITGPGLAVITVVFLKLAAQAVKFTKESLSSLIGVTTEAQKQKAIQTSLVTLFGQNAKLSKEMLRTDISRTEKEKIILGLLREQVAEANTLNRISKQAAATLYAKGYGANLTPKRGRAYGHIPNFAHPEREQAARGGYAAGNIRSMNMPGEGSIVYNSAETVKNFAGFKQPAIMPPQSSKAGKNYQQAFGNIHGFDPYAAGGYIPNYAGISTLSPTGSKMGDYRLLLTEGSKRKGQFQKGFGSLTKEDANLALRRSRSKKSGKTKVTRASDLGIDGYLNPNSFNYIGLSASLGPDSPKQTYYVAGGAGTDSGIYASADAAGFKNARKNGKYGAKIDVEFKALDGSDKQKAYGRLDDEMNSSLQAESKVIADKILGRLGRPEIKKGDLNTDLPHSKMAVVSGHIFEAVTKTVLRQLGAEGAISDKPNELIDLGPNKELYELFGIKKGEKKGEDGAEVKINTTAKNVKSLARKIYSLHTGSHLKTKGKTKAYGYIPNFAAMAISRLGGLGKSKFGLAAVINSNPYFAQVLRRYGHWKNFPPQEKAKLNKFLLKQGFTNRALQGYGLASMHSKSIGEGISNIAAAGGYIPNFADPLSDAIGREKAAGVPVSQIRVGSHSALMSKGNPLGLGVTNTKDEPNGLRDVFGANGFVPNYAEGFQGFTRSDVNISGRNLSAQDKLVEELNRKLKVYIDKFKKGSMNQQQLNNAIAGLSQKTKNQSASSQRVTRSTNESIGYISRLNASRRKLTSSLGGMVGRMGRGMGGGMGAMAIGMASGFVNREESPGLAGAMEGASTGAMIGSMFGPFGTLIGTASGALYGFISATDEATEAQKKARMEYSSQLGQQVGAQLQSIPSVEKIIGDQLEVFEYAQERVSGYKHKISKRSEVQELDEKAMSQLVDAQNDLSKEIINQVFTSLPEDYKFEAQEIISKSEREKLGENYQPQTRLFSAEEYKKELKGLSDDEKTAYLKRFISAQKDAASRQEEVRKGVLKQLDLQRVMLESQRAAADAQFEIKKSYMETANSLKAQSQIMGHLMSEEQKARLKHAEAINKSTETYALAKSAAEQAFKSGILQQIQSGPDKDILQSELKKILKGENITEQIAGMTPEQLLDTLEKIKIEGNANISVQKIINELIQHQINLRDNSLTKAEQQHTLETNQANATLKTNAALAERKDLMIDVNREMKEYVQGLNTSSELRSIESRIKSAEFGSGPIRSQEEIFANERRLVSERQQNIREQYTKSAISNMAKLATDMGLTQEQRLKIAADPSKLKTMSVEAIDSMEKEFKSKGGSREITKLDFLIKHSSIGPKTEDQLKLESDRKQKLNELKTLEQSIADAKKQTSEEVDFITKQLNDQLKITDKKISAEERLQKIKEREYAKRTGPGAFSYGIEQGQKSLQKQVETMNYELGQNIPRNFADGLASAMTQALNGAKDLDDALTDAAINFLGAIQQALMQQAAYSIVGAMGFPMSRGGGVRNYSRGGGVPAMVTNGEYVMNSNAVNKYGSSFMHSLNAGGKLPGYAAGGQASGSALAANFGGGRAVTSGRLYQSKAMSGYFYSGQAGNVGLQEDEGALMGVLAEEERQRQKKLQKKAKRRALLQQIIGTIASVGIAYGVRGMGNSFGKPGSPGNTWQGDITNAPGSAPAGMLDAYNGGPVKKYASGGYISGKPGIDQIPAMLSEGEYVIRASSARQIGKPTLDMINAGKFNQGGAVTPMQESSDSGISGGNTNNINISINMERGKSSSEKKDSDVGVNPAEKSQDEEGSSALAEKIKAQVVSVIVEEQRPGGLLSEKS